MIVTIRATPREEDGKEGGDDTCDADEDGSERYWRWRS